MSIACCVQGCGASVCFDEAVESRLRRTHESWMCPFGHRQHFVAKTEDEERIEKLKKIISLRERDLRWWQDHWNETERAFGTCPVVDCGWRSQSAIHRRWGQMLRHFYKAHPIIMGDSDLLEATRPLKAVS